MAGASEFGARQSAVIDVAQITDSQVGGGAFTGGAAVIIGAGGEFMFHHRVGDDETHIVRERNGVVGEIAAVYAKSAAFFAETTGEWVHDAALHAGEFVFGALAKPGNFGTRPVAGAEGEGCSHGERGGGAESTPDG